SLAVPSLGAARPERPEDWRHNIVVATDGRLSSDTALIAAHAFAGRSTFVVASVLAEPASKDRVSGWSRVPETPSEHRQMVDAQVRRVLGDAADVWIEVRRGYPPEVLAAFAEAHAASLLVAGIGRPNVLDRLLGDESTLRLARMTQNPLYAVAA